MGKTIIRKDKDRVELDSVTYQRRGGARICVGKFAPVIVSRNPPSVPGYVMLTGSGATNKEAYWDLLERAYDEIDRIGA